MIGIFPVPCDKGTLHGYGVSAMAFAHSNDVTALSILPKLSESMSDDVLISAGRDGKVHLYPNAFSARHQFEVHSRILCCENKAPVLSLASCEKEGSLFIFTGDEAGKIIMWKSRLGSTSIKRNRDVDQSSLSSHASRARAAWNFEPIFTVPPLDPGSKIVELSLFNNDVLVSGTNSGDVQVWDVAQKQSYTKKKRKSASLPQPNSRLKLAQRFLVPIAHSGNITSLSFFGDVLLTTGGNDGFTKAWSMNSSSLLGTITNCEGADSSKLCSQKNLSHTEKLVFSYDGLKSAVMSNIFCNQSIISLSRDGRLCRWQYGLLSEQKIMEPPVEPSDAKVKCVYCEHMNVEGEDYCQKCHEPLVPDDDSDLAQQQLQDNSSESDGSDEEDDSDADFNWKCLQCDANNTTSFTRCSSCYAWRSTGSD